MTVKEKLKRIVNGQDVTLDRGDVVKIVNYIKNLEGELRRLSRLKREQIKITIVG